MHFNQILEKSRFSGHLPSVPYLLIPCLLATWLYAPGLFFGRIQIFGDSIIHSLSVIEFNRKLLHEGISPLWTNLLCGGHPYFAEGQGGFLYPLNFLVALFFNPITGLIIYSWLSIMIGALGMFCLCRHFKCSPEASTFGALAVVFSTFWIQYHDNITVSGALCCLPWVFLCFERWIKHPSITSSLWLALSLSLLIFAGYPQALHGAVIYMAVSLLPTLFAGYIGSRADNSLRQYVITGLVAIIVCIGLSAIQWLPLLELASLSHRSGGMGPIFPTFPSRVLRGFLFSAWNTDAISRVAGSTLVCFVASLSLIIKPNHRMIGQIIAIGLLIMLGMDLPVCIYLRHFSIIPGLKYFRIVHLYLGISIIGIALLGSIAIDRIQKQAGGSVNQLKDKIIFIAAAAILFLMWMGLALQLRVEQVAIAQYTSLISAYVVLMIFIVVKKQKWFGYAMLFFIVIEVVMVRIVPLTFSDSKLLAKPQFAHYIQTDVRNKDYKLMDISSSWGIGMLPLWSPKLEVENRKAFMRLAPSTNVLWNMPSMDGLLALQLARHQLIQPRIIAEIKGVDSSLPGTRLIDYLGIRYISADAVIRAPGFEPLIFSDILFLENRNALPRVQSFTRYEMTNSANDALHHIKHSKETTLFLEPPFNKNEGVKDLPVSTNMNIPNALEILSSTMTNMQYKFDVYARQAAWLFIADANYPGWQANIDGLAAPVYSAQVLGKAVLVPAGRHQITVAFKPRSFIIGFSLTLLTLIVLSAMGIRKIYLKRLHPDQS